MSEPKQNNELLQAILSVVPESAIREMISGEIRDKVDDMFSYTLRNETERAINKAIAGRIERHIDAEVQKIMDGQVRTDDGWGSHEEYGSFEDMVRQKIAKEIRSSWNVERKIRDMVEARIKEICKSVVKDGTDAITDYVLLKLGEEKKK